MKPNAYPRWKSVGAALVLLATLSMVAVAAADPSRGAGADESAAKGNRIEVSGNSASNVEVRCKPGGTRPRVSVNSVNVDPGALRGKTVIVTGRNTQDVRVNDCPPAADGQQDGVNVNSVNIR